MGPSAFRVADIHQKVRDLGYDVVEHGDLEVSIPETQAAGNPRLKYLKEIRETCAKLRDTVGEILKKESIPVGA